MHKITNLPVGCTEVGIISTISVAGVTSDAESNHGFSFKGVSSPAWI